MSFQGPGNQVLYHADHNLVHHLRAIREQLHSICRKHINQKVRVETMDGQVYEGTIVDCEGGILYLRIEEPHNGHRQFTPLILTLVLYELLIITLLSLYP